MPDRPPPVWRIAFGDSLAVQRDGEAHRFRTRQQLLLVARLASEPESRDGESLDRAEAARLLWPEAEKANGLAYLRRAVMELRVAGVELVSEGEGLALAPGTCDSDFLDASASGSLGLEGERLMPGWESPMLDEIRRRIRAQRRRAGPIHPESASSGEEAADRNMLALLGQSLLNRAPAQAMALVAANRYDFYTKAPEPDLLRFLHRLCVAAPEPSPDRIAVTCVMAGISAIQTQYHAADGLYREAIRDGESLGAPALLARAHAMRGGMLVERRAWAEAESACERAVAYGRESENAHAIAFSMAALAAYQWHVGQYDASVQSYLVAIDHAEPGPHQDIARHNLAFVWGVLGGHMDPPPTMGQEPDYVGTHLPGSRGYEIFSLGIGHGRYREAALGAAAALALAADGGMERLVAIGLDNAAIAFAKLVHVEESAACVRLGTRLRSLLEHPRSPMEDDALRRHVDVPYFGPGVREWIARWRAADPGATAHRVAARLRIVAGAT